MTTAPVPKPMPELPRPGQRVRWFDPPHARACGWEAVFGPGPFEVVRVVDRSDQGLAAGLLLRTEVGEAEISEVWLALADGPEGGTGSGTQTAGEGHTACEPAFRPA